MENKEMQNEINNEIFLKKLEIMEPNLFKIHEFMKMASGVFGGYGEAEVKIIIHCVNYTDKRMTLEASQGEKRVKRSYLVTEK